MTNILKISILVSTILVPTLVKAQATSPLEVSSTVIPGCFIEADNINFGNLIMRLINQSAQSNMRVHCSNGSNLSIGIEYSLSNNSTGNITVQVYETVHHKVYIDSKALSSNKYDFSCAIGEGMIRIFTDQMWNFSGYQKISNITDVLDTKGVCKAHNTPNLDVLNSFVGYLGGSLTGLLKGDVVKYSLEIPDNSTKIWSKNTVYNVVATGIQQTIPMKANIKTTNNPTYRMTPDSYQDTLTVVLTY